MPVIPVTSLDQFKEIINNGKVSVFDFWATWCGPCRVISPVFEKYSNSEETSSIDYYKVDVDEQPDIAQEVGIRAMPTFMVFKDGQKFDELIGAKPSDLNVLIVKATSLNPTDSSQ